MSLICLAAVALDALVDLLLVGPVVGGSGLHESQRQLEIRGGLVQIAIVVVRG